MAVVSLHGVKKTYDKLEVIHGIDMEIADGEFIVIVGPSGCGKSTLLRMVAGLERITGGQVAIGDRVVNELEPKDRDIAMVFLYYALYPHMSVYDNMAFGLKMRKFAKPEIKKRVNEAAEIIHGVAHPDANIIFGSVIDEDMGEEVRVTVIAAGFERWEAQAPARTNANATESTGRDESRSRVLGAETAHEDIFATPADDDLDLGDDDFDVPSFLR